ncbi:unnamed protein product [Peniophora sp. CBMAI 1063]|nr:unnamed protein product [Peniophora sp. CBMAI 1063]
MNQSTIRSAAIQGPLGTFYPSAALTQTQLVALRVLFGSAASPDETSPSLDKREQTSTQLASADQAEGKRQSRARTRPKAEIPRSPNCFMIFRGQFLHAPEWQPIRESAAAMQYNLSKLAGKLWASMDDERKQSYRRLQDERAREHRLLNPNYRYKPKRREQKTRQPAKRPLTSKKDGRKQIEEETLVVLINQFRSHNELLGSLIEPSVFCSNANESPASCEDDKASASPPSISCPASTAGSPSSLDSSIYEASIFEPSVFCLDESMGTGNPESFDAALVPSTSSSSPSVTGPAVGMESSLQQTTLPDFDMSWLDELASASEPIFPWTGDSQCIDSSLNTLDLNMPFADFSWFNDFDTEQRLLDSNSSSESDIPQSSPVSDTHNNI